MMNYVRPARRSVALMLTCCLVLGLGALFGQFGSAEAALKSRQWNRPPPTRWPGPRPEYPDSPGPGPQYPPGGPGDEFQPGPPSRRPWPPTRRPGPPDDEYQPGPPTRRPGPPDDDYPPGPPSRRPGPPDDDFPPGPPSRRPLPPTRFPRPPPTGRPDTIVNPDDPWEGSRCMEKRTIVDTCSTSAILGYLGRNSCCDEMRIYCPPIYCSTKIYEACKPDRQWCKPHMRDWDKLFDEIKLVARKKLSAGNGTSSRKQRKERKEKKVKKEKKEKKEQKKSKARLVHYFGDDK